MPVLRFDDWMRMMPAAIVFVRRYAPDWQSLSQEFRAGEAIDPARYLPPAVAPGFPPDIPEMAAAWNARLPIDWFAFRAALAEISAKSVQAVAGAEVLNEPEPEEILRRTANGDGLVYFHDDDDVFSPGLPEVLTALVDDTDAVVTPSYEISATALETIVRNGRVPSVVVGRVSEQAAHARYQTNNTGIRFSRLTTSDDVVALRDHITSSAYANEHGFRDCVLGGPISATIKSPASVNMMRLILRPDEPSHLSALDFVRAFDDVNASVPSEWDWLRLPLAEITDLCRGLEAGR